MFVISDSGWCIICNPLLYSAASPVLAGEVPAPALVRDHRKLGGRQEAEGVAAGMEAVSGQGSQAGQAADDEGEKEEGPE